MRPTPTPAPRRVWVTREVAWLRERGEWKGLEGAVGVERAAKRGIAGKRLKAGWDDNYLLKVLGI